MASYWVSVFPNECLWWIDFLRFLINKRDPLPIWSFASNCWLSFIFPLVTLCIFSFTPIATRYWEEKKNRLASSIGDNRKKRVLQILTATPIFTVFTCIWVCVCFLSVLRSHFNYSSHATTLMRLNIHQKICLLFFYFLRCWITVILRTYNTYLCWI